MCVTTRTSPAFRLQSQLARHRPGFLRASRLRQPPTPKPDPLDRLWFYLYLDEGSSFTTVRDNWCPAERFLTNANGPGNTWENNGPKVPATIRNAAGLGPAFRDLLGGTTDEKR
jgi:hypothetical protein